MAVREDVSYEVEDDAGLLYKVEKMNGGLTAEVRVCGCVVVDGQRYSYDRNVRVRLTKDK